jgi:serine/threonine-protein kinase
VRDTCAGPLDSTLDDLLSERVRDWMRGECTPVKTYLSRLRGACDASEAALELINQEIILRQMRGDQPVIDDYLPEFAELCETLTKLFDVHGVLAVSIVDGEPRGAAATQSAVAQPRLRLPVSLPEIAGYQVERVLGHGGVGVVYLARHIALQRQVALKLLHEEYQTQSDHRARFEREAAALARCKHPNLVQIHEIGEHDGRLFLALEYVEGGTLAWKLAGAPEPPRQAAELVETLARAIEHAHSRGVVHRDLKPGNILLTVDGQPKITDFGLAKIVEAATQTDTGAILGTLAYMAPEQARGGAIKAGPLSDIHGLGAIFYEMLTGQPPYRAETHAAMLQKLMTDDVAAPSTYQAGLPRDLEAICLKCLEKSPQKRYATAVALAEDLRRFLRGEPVLVRRPGPVRRVLKWAKRRPWQMTSLATLFVAAGVVIGLIVRHDRLLRAEVKRTAAKAAEARRNYVEARGAINGMLQRLADPRVEGSPRLLDLRHDQREAALAFYDTILNRVESNDPVVLADAAAALCEASDLQQELGQVETAAQGVERGLKLIRAAVAEEPGHDEYRDVQARCLSRLCVLLRLLNQPDAAVARGREAVEVAEAVAHAAPEDVDRQESLAKCHNNYAAALKDTQQFSLALFHCDQSIAIRKRLDPTKQPDVTVRIAQTLINKGSFLWAQRRPEQAEDAFRQAKALLLSRLTGRPDHDAHTLISLAQLETNWSGLLHSDPQRASESISRAEAGLKWIEPYLRNEPNDQGARTICLKLHGNRGTALAQAGRYAESAQAFARVVELAGDPVPANYRLLLASQLAKTGDSAGVLHQAELIKLSPGISPVDRYNMACILSDCAAFVRADSRLTGPQRTRTVESDVTEAMAWLRAASESGLFRDREMRESARNDAALEILRARPEFRNIIAGQTTDQ